jgi:hypothetical protein
MKKEKTMERSAFNSMNQVKRLAVTLLGILAIAGAASAAPRLTIPVGEFDFGFVPQNSSISHVFWLHSSGEDSLKIVRVSPG